MLYLNQSLMRGSRPPFAAHHGHDPRLGLGATSKQAWRWGLGGSRRKRATRTKSFPFGQWEWMTRRQLSVHDAHPLDCKLHENGGCVFSWYCIPSIQPPAWHHRCEMDEFMTRWGPQAGGLGLVPGGGYRQALAPKVLRRQEATCSHPPPAPRTDRTGRIILTLFLETFDQMQ